MAGKSVLPWLLAAVLCGLAVPASGGPSPVSADVRPLTMRPRNEAPWFVDVELRSKSHALLEGTLEIDGWSGRKLIFRQQTPDLELAPGVTRQRLLLPASPDMEGIEDVQLRFSTATGTYDLGRFPTTVSAGTRQYAIGICREATAGSAGGVAVWQALRPERLDNNQLRTRSLASSPIWFSPEDFPTPLGLCAFDVVMVERDALTALTPRQLDDLAVWVEAGGSLLVAPPERLDKEHVDFLNRLAGSPANPAPIGRNADGTIIRPSIVQTTALQDNSLLFHRAGLGRCVVAFEVPAEEDRLMGKQEWMSATYFLAHLNTGEDEARNLRSQFNGYYLSALIEQRLVQSLPRTMRMIPLPVLSGILGAFVMLVGPGEWLVLGRLRRRRWTWITFPLVAVACAFLTVRAAEYYLGRADQGTTMVITDFTEEGRPLRENRFELQLSGRSRETTSECRDALTVPCPNVNSAPMASGGPMIYNRGALIFQMTAPPGEAGAPLYRGRLPGRYTLSCGLGQWTLYFQRSLTFGSAAPAASLHWAAVHWENSTEQANLARWVQESIGAQGWKVSVWRAGRRMDAPSSDVAPRNNYRNRFAQQPSDLAAMLVVKLPQGSIPISPSGQANLDDLALNNTRWDWVVVAERQVGNEIQIQRCLYHSPDNE